MQSCLKLSLSSLYKAPNEWLQGLLGFPLGSRPTGDLPNNPSIFFLTKGQIKFIARTKT